jgi:hypothetical protein
MRLRGTLIKIPAGLAASGEPYLPDIRRLYWLREALLDPEDPEVERPCAVLLLPAAKGEEILVGLRSSTERNGQHHPKHPQLGLTKEGWFSRGRRIDPELWTPDNTESMNLLLDEETYSYVLADLHPTPGGGGQ